jgi:hypothetical protein
MASSGAISLVHRPVPRRDQATNTYGFLDHQRGTNALFKLKGLECPDRCFDMLRTAGGLGVPGQTQWCAHLVHYGFGNLVKTFGELGQNRLEQLNPLLASRLRVGFESPLRGSNGKIDVGCRAQADAAAGFFGRRIDDIDGVRSHRIDPLAVDVEFEHFAHDVSRESSGESYPKTGVSGRFRNVL